MTSVNTNNLDQAIAGFQSLPVEEQLSGLGILFKEVSSSVPADALSTASSADIRALIQQIKELGQDEQLQTLSALLSSKGKKGGEVALDPNPSQALAELVTGNPKVDLSRYQTLDANSRLAFWYQLGQQLSDTIPVNSSLSAEADELLTSLRSLDAEQQAAFLSQTV